MDWMAAKAEVARNLLYVVIFVNACLSSPIDAYADSSQAVGMTWEVGIKSTVFWWGRCSIPDIHTRSGSPIRRAIQGKQGVTISEPLKMPGVVGQRLRNSIVAHGGNRVGIVNLPPANRQVIRVVLSFQGHRVWRPHIHYTIGHSALLGALLGGAKS